MCCTLEPAELSKTILYAGDATIDGQYRHVLGYQNRAENLFDGPNAMILPFPAVGKMGPENVIDVTGGKDVLSNMAASFQIRLLSRRSSDSLKSASFGSYVEVFDSGDYTIVLADDARDIPQVLHRVSENKRPRLNKQVFEAYAKWYPNWPIALCCFEAKKAVENQPLLWWYLPQQHDQLFLPAVDGHTGHAPNLKANVYRDHTLVVGTSKVTAQLLSQGHKVYYSKADQHSADLKKYLPTHIIGSEVKTQTLNNDFRVRTANVHEARFSFDTAAPPGA